jgi:ABC-type multidrug transport system fused ATPase/permease subunit
MTAGNGQVAPAGVSADAASQLRRGAGRTGRAGPGTGPVTGVGGRGSAVPAVRVEGVVKRFGATVALDGAGLEVPAGMVFGLLGPNGAGKTTLVRILATLLAPDGGRAEVFGRDVAAEPAAVRELIGLTGQFAAVDPLVFASSVFVPSPPSRTGCRRSRQSTPSPSPPTPPARSPCSAPRPH